MPQILPLYQTIKAKPMLLICQIQWDILSSFYKLFSDTTITTNRNFLRRIPFHKSVYQLPPPSVCLLPPLHPTSSFAFLTSNPSSPFRPFVETNNVCKKYLQLIEFVNKGGGGREMLPL